jgi:hypothetical protein
MRKCLLIAKQLGFEPIFNKNLATKAHYDKGSSFFYRFDASSYDILHEIGHCIMGYGCCKEHDEYIAHGIAIGIAKIKDIKLSQSNLNNISVYAGSSSPLACPNRTKNNIQSVKKK